MKILIFDVSGEFAHFRKFNTTSSPLTYTIPTRTAITGLLGAILGIGREEFYDHFLKEKASLAVQVLNPIRKQGYGFNLINTKEGMYRIKNRTQVRFEFVADPAYRVFLAHSDTEIFNSLKERIEKKDYTFQPYLGLAQLTSDVTFVDLVDAVNESSNGTPVDVISAVNLDQCTGKKVVIDPDLKYSSAIMPMEMVIDREDTTVKPPVDGSLPKNRKTTEYAEVIYETSGLPVKVIVDSFINVPGYGNILFL